MDIAVFSDIHGNGVAFEQCIRYALDRGIQTFIMLGDYISEHAYPQRTMKLIYDLMEKYTCYCIRGNKEDMYLSYQANGETGWRHKDSSTGSLLYSYSNLTQKDMDFYDNLEYTKVLIVGDMEPITICHGSIRKVNEKMLPDDQRTYDLIDQQKTRILLCGHTHVQTTIKHNDKIVWNPGAVGVSLHSGGKAQFMILHSKEKQWQEEFVSLDYDVEQEVRDMHESGLYAEAPCWCKTTEHLMRTGEISHGTILFRAMDYCREETGCCNWPDIPEKFFERAVNELIGE